MYRHYTPPALERLGVNASKMIIDTIVATLIAQKNI